MLLVVDNGSVYTKNLLEFLSNLNRPYHVSTHDKISQDELQKYETFILSGRRNNNSQMNAKNTAIIKHAISNKNSLLGICYGAEILALTAGGTIKKMTSIHKGDENVSILQKNPLCIGEISVFESHNYEISKLGNHIIPIGRSKRCNNEIIWYRDSKIFGTQFHPEMSPDGHKIIENFCNL
ncbi:MAG: glutamine amidotransferase [Crenarchaeota archaeon]|nr:MAG: glutamine amidotransferase [Thermoproteota archaeon]RDJ33399.1 MAG: glutamine amidotransferase [Thermoproteota archaeon]RDJ36096.1 MAG: glutamine amidotransferase [Thermoproteota archaeon]RDJ38729.1 MAG: glutamine amidotransferase [Thermoproteota archaeon]